MITCLADLFRPSVGFAAVKLLQDAGCDVHVPETQTCCGQPAFNSGDRADAESLARQVITAFEPYDHVVVPSASCAGMMCRHYDGLFDDGTWIRRARELAAKTHELVSFLTDVRGVETLSAAFEETVTYHDSCSALRDLAIKDQPRRLLAAISGLKLEEMRETEACCGFGGAFCVKYPAISGSMVGKKTANIAATGATTVLSGDLGCLLNIAGRLKREGSKVRARHIAEILAGMTDNPAIGEPSGGE
ncbi:MAG: (Fe-S)-binding protein [Rhizobiales bacterium]|nr:(Fe-S)-binding protein [Hyphomicrobiales bacterium]